MGQIHFAEPTAPEPLTDHVSAQTPDLAHLFMIRPIRRIACTVACVTLGLTPVTAAAGEDVLVWPRTPATSQDGVDAALRAAGHRPRDFTDPRARMLADDEAVHAATRAALTAIEAALNSARAAFLAQRYDDMIATLLRAEADALIALPEGQPCSATMWELQFQIGLAHATRGGPGDPELARARFALALAIDPERRPVAALYGPDVALTFLKVVDELTRRPARPVRVAVTPSDASVTVDCRPLAPQAGLRPGLHLVRVDAPGFTPHTSLTTLGDAPALQLSLETSPSPAPGPWWIRGALDPASASARAAVQSFVGPVRVVFLEATDAGHVARLMHAGQLRRVARADTAGEAAVMALAVDTRDAPPPKQPPDRRRRRGLWLGLAGAALGSVALGLGLGLGLRDAPGAHLQLVVR